MVRLDVIDIGSYIRISNDMRLLAEYKKLENPPSFSGMGENSNMHIAGNETACLLCTKMTL